MACRATVLPHLEITVMEDTVKSLPSRVVDCPSLELFQRCVDVALSDRLRGGLSSVSKAWRSLRSFPSLMTLHVCICVAATGGLGQWFQMVLNSSVTGAAHVLCGASKCPSPLTPSAKPFEPALTFCAKLCYSPQCSQTLMCQGQSPCLCAPHHFPQLLLD